MHILVTRPLDQAVRTENRLTAMGHRVSLAPMLEIAYSVPPGLDARLFQAILVTSANAVRALSRHANREAFISLPLIAVGDRTAEAASDAGFQHVRSADGTVEALAAHVVDILEPRDGALLYAAGRDRAGDLEGRLRHAGFQVEVAISYAARTIDRFPPTVLNDLVTGRIDAILLYSARSAGAFLSALQNHEVGIDRLAGQCVFGVMSDSVATPLKRAGLPDSRIRIPESPNETALLRSLGL